MSAISQRRPTLIAEGDLTPFLDRAGLTVTDQWAWRDAVDKVGYLNRKGVIREQEDEAQGISIVCSGVVNAIGNLENGRQQIVAIFVAGDAMECQPFPADGFRLCVITVAHFVCRDSGDCAARPSIALVLWRDTARYEAIQQEKLVSVGRQNSLPGRRVLSARSPPGSRLRDLAICRTAPTHDDSSEIPKSPTRPEYRRCMRTG